MMQFLTGHWLLATGSFPLPLLAALPYKGNLSLRLWRNWQTR